MLLNCDAGEDFEIPLDCKEIKQVDPKGNQSWIFIGRIDAEVEALILWPPDDEESTHSLMLGNIEGRRRRGRQRMRWLDGITDSMDMNLSKLQQMVKNREAWHAAFHRAAKVGHNSVTERNWTDYFKATTIWTLGVPFAHIFLFVVVVHSLSHVQLFATPWTVARQASLSFTISQSLLKFMSIESVRPSNHPILCHHLLLLLSIFPSICVFCNESALPIRWPKYWSFSFSISPSNDYSGLISFRIDWFNLLAAQGILTSLL